MRVLFSLLDAGIGGGQQVATWIAQGLVTRGDSVGLLVPARGPAVEGFEALGARVHFAHLQRLRQPRDVRNVAKVLRNYDALYSHTAIGGQLLGDAAARLARRPHLIHQHTYPQFSTRPLDATLQRTLFRILLGRRPFIAVAPHVRQGLIGCKVRPDSICVIANGVPLPEVAPPRNYPPLRIGMLGRFDPGKGMLTFIEAASASGLDPDEVQFVVGASSGPFHDYEIQVRDRAQDAGVAVVEPGTGGTGFLLGLDILVMPSRYEGSPLTLLEAMSLGKPVVGTDIPGIRAIVGETDAGFLIPVDDSAALQAVFRRLAGDPQARTTAGAAGRRLVEANYTRDRMIGETLGALDRTVSAR